MGETPVLQLWGVGKRYGLWRKREVLRDVHLSVAPGECYGLAGPNGAGKTTLIRLLLGLSLPDTGEVRLFGLRPDDPDVRRRVGFVPEAAELPPNASPRALVRRFARLRGLALGEAEGQGTRQLERMGLGALLDRPAHRFSKGERQRTLLALALLGEPELLVLDEPTDGLDPLGRALVRRVLQEERAKGRTVFLNSHLLSETERVCSRVGILHRGRLVREQRIDRDVALGVLPACEREERASTAVVLAAPLPAAALEAAGARAAPSLQGEVTESAGATVLIDHVGLPALNAALDRLRAAGGLFVEVRRVREDLEATFEAAVTAEPAPSDSAAAPPPAALEPAAPPPAALEPAAHPGRPFLAALRVSREIAADLSARRVGWMAVLLAVGIAGFFLWAVRNDLVAGAAVAAHRFGAPAGLTDEEAIGRWAGRWVASAAFWVLLTGSLALSALFAPPVLDPRRTILLLAQPLGRGDLALGIFSAVCGLALCAQAFLTLLVFLGLRALGLLVPLQFLLLPLPLIFSFAALYAVVLLATYAVRSGPFAMAVALGSLLAVLFLGNSHGARAGAPLGVQSVLATLVPRIVPLSQQAMHAGASERMSLSPFVLTAAFTAALLIGLQFLARRSER